MSDNVYIQSNEPEGNRVLAFRRDPDGTLIQRGTFSTGGSGTGTPHLQSQGSVVITGDGRHLLVTNAGSGKLCLSLEGPEGATMLVRNVAVDGPAHPWIRDYRRCETQTLILKTNVRPFIGVPVDTPPERISFLQQQGYIVEASDNPRNYSVYLEPPGSVSENKRALLTQIEESHKPLVKLGRWPDNARSALAITGDIDALTLWDYGLRYLGH